MTGGLDARPLAERQRRFGHDVDGYLRLVERLHGFDDVRVGVCFHSLRAVPAGPMRTVLESLPATLPVHIHVAEQEAEVRECLAVRGARPVAWLLDHMPVDFLWTLVHATHLDEAEVRGIAARGATVALCPTTEANLGDGLFPLHDFMTAGGVWGIGSDSHVSTSPIEELRWLEYGQRLRARRRNVTVLPHLPSAGETLWSHALAGGARGSMQPVGALEAGQRADLLVLDDAAPELAARDASTVVDTWIFSGNRNLVREVFAGGQRVVVDGRHVKREAVAARYRRTVEALAP
jgi:formimidoylglutamate deiminase